MRVRTRERGQSVVEFGILALLFALMMFAIVEFGLLLNGWVTVSSVARDTARWAATGKNAGDIYDENVVTGPAPPGVSPTQLKFELTYEPPNSALKWVCDSATLKCVLGATQLDWHAFPSTAVPPLTPGTTVSVKVTADTYEVITPLVRQLVFQCSGSQAHCYVPIQSSMAMYFEGPR